MSKTHKIEKARAIHSKKLNGIQKAHKPVSLIVPGRFGNRIEEGGVRHGNKRKTLADIKVKDRRAQRKKNNRPDAE